MVGAPKCATSAMYEYLKQHPEIFMPEWKEPHFFGEIIPPNRSVRNKEQYKALFADANDEKRLGSVPAAPVRFIT